MQPRLKRFLVSAIAVVVVFGGAFAVAVVSGWDKLEPTATQLIILGTLALLAPTLAYIRTLRTNRRPSREGLK